MLQTIGCIIGRVLIILLAAGVVAGSVVALSQSAFGAGSAGFPGGSRDGQAQAVGAPPDGGSAPFPGAGADLGRPDGGREAQSFARGLPELFKNVVIVGFLVGVISLVQHGARQWRHTAQIAS